MRLWELWRTEMENTSEGCSKPEHQFFASILYSAPFELDILCSKSRLLVCPVCSFEWGLRIGQVIATYTATVQDQGNYTMLPASTTDKFTLYNRLMVNHNMFCNARGIYHKIVRKYVRRQRSIVKTKRVRSLNNWPQY